MLDSNQRCGLQSWQLGLSEYQRFWSLARAIHQPGISARPVARPFSKSSHWQCRLLRGLAWPMIGHKSWTHQTPTSSCVHQHERLPFCASRPESSSHHQRVWPSSLFSQAISRPCQPQLTGKKGLDCRPGESGGRVRQDVERQQTLAHLLGPSCRSSQCPGFRSQTRNV